MKKLTINRIETKSKARSSSVAGRGEIVFSGT